MTRRLALGLIVLLSLHLPTRAAVDIRPIDQPVESFPATPDLSTPESALATICRMIATGDEDWPAVSAPRLAAHMKKSPKQDVPPDLQRLWLSARIVEVDELKPDHASVILQLRPTQFNLRTFSRDPATGKWLNEGEDALRTLEQARARATQLLSTYVTKPPRPPIPDPEAHLRPFVDYLRKSGQPPKDFLLSAFDKHTLVAIGEVHHRPDYWCLNRSLVEDPRFPKLAATLYLELPSHGQTLVDQFLAADTPDPAPVIDVLRDMMDFGWPDQETVEFFQSVWRVNHALPPDQRLRILLVDMPRPYKDIRTRADWHRYDVDRDKYMADNILSDRQAHGRDRGALFIAGFMHVIPSLSFAADPAQSLPTAGHHLRAALGDMYFAVQQHSPSIHNVGGRCEGRPALGLFDSAFAANANRPVAFDLLGSPFASLPYDASADHTALTSATYGDAFDAYLFLLPLENERFATMVPNFYTDDFLKEVDRRLKLLGNRGLNLSNPAALRNRLESEWGAPRTWTSQLGPLDAWKSGSTKQTARTE